jgi:hypothetical protein
MLNSEIHKQQGIFKMRTTEDFVKDLLETVERTSDPYVNVFGIKQGSELCNLVCCVHNLDLAIWQPTTQQVYVRVQACETYLNSKEFSK